MDPSATIAMIIDLWNQDDEIAAFELFDALLTWFDGGGFLPTIADQQIQDLANAFESYANDKTSHVSYVMANGWNGSINSMTYAVQSTGGVTRGTCKPSDANDVEWITQLWSSLETELRDCVRIAGDSDELAVQADYYDLEEFQRYACEIEKLGNYLTEAIYNTNN